MLQLTCPHCGFSKSVRRETLPPSVTRATCPRCRQPFAVSVASPVTETPEAAGPDSAQTRAGIGHSQEEVATLPKAGFWLRVVATLLDGFLVFMMQLVLGLLLAFAGVVSSGGAEQQLGAMMSLVQLFTYVLSFAYYVFFTGYCGQTPGKMALRIKVIRRDGAPVSYLRAAFREVPCKFVSAILFGIGYLMVAFDEQKQGLHDRMADTYVIKL